MANKKSWAEIKEQFEYGQGVVNYAVSVHTGYLNDKIDGEFPPNEILDRMYDTHNRKYRELGREEPVEQAEDIDDLFDEFFPEEEKVAYTISIRICKMITESTVSREEIGDYTIGVYEKPEVLITDVLQYAEYMCQAYCGWSIEEVRIQDAKDTIANWKDPERIKRYLKYEWLTPEQVGYEEN